VNQEREIVVRNGWQMLTINIGVLLGAILMFVVAVTLAAFESAVCVLFFLVAIPLAVAAGLSLSGHFTLQPNEARVLILFGEYRGTVRESGFHWANPFMTKHRISLRSRNLNGEKLKVNARQKIVHGAVSMVQMALQELDEKNVLELDEERKAAMVSNLLVILCGETEVQPVINTGTLYT